MKSIYEEYDSLIKSHPDEMKDAILFLDQEMGKRNVKFGEETVRTFLKPVFLSFEETENVKNILDHIVSILNKVSKLYFDRPDLKEFFYLNDKAVELLKIDHGYSRNVMIARPDSFFVNGVMRFVEFNCDSPAGAGLCDATEEILNTTFPFREIKEKYELGKSHRCKELLNALLSAYEEFSGSKKKPSIAIVDWKEVRTQNEFQLIKNYFIKAGYETIIADPRELKYTDGRLECNGFPIDLIYRRVIFKELVNRLHQVEDFIKAYKDGKVCMVNPLRSRLAANKALLAIITNQKQFKSLFTEEENHIINKHVPWTRRVLDMETTYEDNLVFLHKHITAHKDSLVLKPADSYGGKDVIIGRECDQVDWEILINRVLSQKEDWVVQKYVDITQIDVPVLNSKKIEMVTKKYNLNPFVFGGRYAGSMARLSDESVINVSAGGGLVPVVEYKPRT